MLDLVSYIYHNDYGPYESMINFTLGRPGFNYQLHPNSSGTKVLCNFKEDSNATGCLVVVLLFPFPFTNTTLDIIEVIASYQFNRTSNTAVGFIPDYTPERYIMGAYEITEIRNGTYNNESTEVPNARRCAVCRKKKRMHTFTSGVPETLHSLIASVASCISLL